MPGGRASLRAVSETPITPLPSRPRGTPHSRKAKSVVDDEFEDEAFEAEEEDVEDGEDLGLDEIEVLDELDEEFEDDDDDDLPLDGDEVAVEVDEVDDDVEDDVEDDLEEDAEDDGDDDEDEEILGFGEKALAEDELLDFVDDSKEDLGVVTVPIGEGEFTCRSCFLVKKKAQLADERKMICFDCA